MTTFHPVTSGTTPVRPTRAPLVVRAMPLVAGVAGLAFALAQGLLPEQAQPFERPGDYLLEALFTLSLVTGALATLALRPLGLVRRTSRFATVAVTMNGGGQGLVAVAAAATAVVGQNTLGPVFLGGLMLTLVGGVLTAVSLVRAGVLPKALAIGFGAALPVSMAVGTWGPMAGAALWLAVAAGVAAASRRG